MITLREISREDIPTLMVTQSSADNVLCFAVHDADLLLVRDALEKAFELGFGRDRAAKDDDLTSLRKQPRFRKLLLGEPAA